MREHEPWFRFESHSALGGCCDHHPLDTPLFPERFSFDKLMRLKERFGNYYFSCQYLNNPSAPENADFKTEWLNYFTLEYDPQGDFIIHHEVKDGVVRRDLKKFRLSIAMTTDPNHSGNSALGRCRHAIVVLGQSDEGNYYLLDTWAQAASYDTYYNKIFEMAIKWGLHRIGVETIAAQRYIAHHIEHLAHSKGWSVRIDELKGEVEAPDGTMSRKKEWRIRNILAPIAEQGRLFVKRQQQDFINEYQTFPKGKYVDQLDAFAYAPQLLKEPLDYKTHLELLAANRDGMDRLGRPYSAGVGRYYN
jgi:predicted phage terminase large subunit-like protein